MARALSELVASGDGEVWVKLDAWDEATHRRFWGTRGQDEHERRVAAFGSKTPVVLQTMLVHRPEGGTVEQIASGLAAAVGRLVGAGCKVERVVLSTLFREPGTSPRALGDVRCRGSSRGPRHPWGGRDRGRSCRPACDR